MSIQTIMGLSAQLSGNLLSLFAIPFFLSSLGSEQYAVVLFAIIVQGWIMLIDVGFSTAIAREVSDLCSRNNFDKIKRLYFAGLIAFSSGVVLLLGVIYFLFSINTIHLAAYRIIPGEPSNFVLCLILATAITRLLEAYLRGFFQGTDSFYMFFGSLILANFFRILFPVGALIYFSASLETFFSAQLAGSVLICLPLIIELHRRLQAQTSGEKHSFQIDLTTLQPVFKTAIPIIGAAIIVTVGTQLDRLYIAYFISPNRYTELLLAITVASTIPQISQYLGQIYLPSATRQFAKNNISAAFHEYRRFSRLSFVLSCCVAGFLFNFGDFFLGFWLGDRVISERLFEALKLLLAPFLLASIINIPGQLPIVRQQSSVLFKLNVILSLISVSLTILLLPTFTDKVIVLNLFISQTLGFAFLATYATRIFGFRRLAVFYMSELPIIGCGIFIFFYLLNLISIT